MDVDECTFIVKEVVKRILGWSTRCLQLSLLLCVPPFGPVKFTFTCIDVVFSASFERYCTSRYVEGCCNVSFHHFIYSVLFIDLSANALKAGVYWNCTHAFFPHELLIQAADTCLLLTKYTYVVTVIPQITSFAPRRFILSQVLKCIRLIHVCELYSDELQPFIHLHVVDMI